MASLFRALFSSLLELPLLRRWLSFLRLHLFGPAAPAPPEPLSLHLQQMKENADEHAAASPMEDRFRPHFAPSDGPVVAALISYELSLYFTTKVFIKRQPHADELGLDMYGNPVVNPYIADRLRNEAAALQFIRENTSIPVPQFLGLWEENGLLHLKTALVHGGIELRNVDSAHLATAVESVGAQLETEILPQLQKLRRRFVGSADPALPVVVPHLLWAWKDTRTWPRVTAETDAFVFVHSDLDRQNILVDPDTFRIVSIVDWETAGFFPSGWELPKWKVADRELKHQMEKEARKRQLALFGAGFADEET